MLRTNIDFYRKWGTVYEIIYIQINMVNKSNKSNKSLHTAVIAVLNTLVSGIVSLFVTRLIILNYGSDFNGLNATANQLIAMLLIVEGGFTLATNVALFKPLAINDYSKINEILSATRNNFFKIGSFVFLLGLIVTIGFSYIILTPLPRTFIFMVFLMTLISTVFNLIYTTKFQILLQSSQREYIIHYTKLISNIAAQAFVVMIIMKNGDMLLIRFIIMIFSIFNGVLISIIAKKEFKFIDFQVSPDYEAIKGTKDIFIQKITAMIYGTAPILFISAFSGTAYASVYAVYNSIFSILKSAIYSFVNAPRMSLGQLITEEKSNNVIKVLNEYEFVVVYVLLTLLSTTAVLIMPFIGIFTNGINDINYDNWGIALLLVAITYFEIIHIPSGNTINMSGSFKVGRKIQSVSCIVLVVLILIGKNFGIYGILGSILITAILLAILEIIYVHKFYFSDGLVGFFKILLPLSVASVFIIIIEIILLPEISSYSSFFLLGAIIVTINGLLLAGVSYMTNRNLIKSTYERITRIFMRIRYKN